MEFKTKYNIGDKVIVEEDFYPNVSCPICDGTAEVEIKGRHFSCPNCFGSGKRRSEKSEHHTVVRKIDGIHIHQDYWGNVSLKYEAFTYDGANINNGSVYMSENEIVRKL